MIKPIVESARHKFAVAIAEVDHQNQWQRAELGVATVSGDSRHASDVLDAVERWVWAQPEIEVLSCDRSWADPDA